MFKKLEAGLFSFMFLSRPTISSCEVRGKKSLSISNVKSIIERRAVFREYVVWVIV